MSQNYTKSKSLYKGYNLNNDKLVTESKLKKYYTWNKKMMQIYIKHYLLHKLFLSFIFLT